MSHRALRSLLPCALSAALLAAGGAAAESYRVLDGEITRSPGDAERLTGSLEIGPLAPSPLPLPLSGDVRRPIGTDLTVDLDLRRQLRTLRIFDFALQAGSHDFGPVQPIEYQGRTPSLYFQLADLLLVDTTTGHVAQMRLRSGGELVAADDETVTFRFHEFRSGPADASHAEGELDESGLPRRLVLHGTLYEVDETFRIDECPIVILPPDPPPPDDGGVIIIIFDPFEIPPLEQVSFTPPGGVGRILTRVTGGASQIDGQLVTGGSVLLTTPEPALLTVPDLPVVTPGFQALSEPPTLEELGITAPDGAEVTLGDPGAVTVTSEGDLLVAGMLVDIPGLTSLTLVSATRIVVEDGFALPPGVGLGLQTPGSVEIGDGGDVTLDPPDEFPGHLGGGGGGLVCSGLGLVLPRVEREVGSFSLVAAVTQPVDVRVLARRGRVLPWQRRPLAVAILGSDDLDVRDVVAESLRLGPGGAQAIVPRGHRRPWLPDVNHDGHPDLVARFRVSDAGIALGDDEVCLVGELDDGSAIEGCDAIRTWPRWRR